MGSASYVGASLDICQVVLLWAPKVLRAVLHKGPKKVHNVTLNPKPCG